MIRFRYFYRGDDKYCVGLPEDERWVEQANRETHLLIRHIFPNWRYKVILAALGEKTATKD